MFACDFLDDFIDARVGAEGKGVEIARQLEAPLGLRAVGQRPIAIAQTILQFRIRVIQPAGAQVFVDGLLEPARQFQGASFLIKLIPGVLLILAQARGVQ